MSQKWVLGIPMAVIAIAFGCLVYAFIDSQKLPTQDEEPSAQGSTSSTGETCTLPTAPQPGTDAAPNPVNTGQTPGPNEATPNDKPIGNSEQPISIEARVGELVSNLASAVTRKNEMGQYALVDDLVKLGKDALPMLESAAAQAENPAVKAHIGNAITRIQAR